MGYRTYQNRKVVAVKVRAVPAKPAANGATPAGNVPQAKVNKPVGGLNGAPPQAPNSDDEDLSQSDEDDLSESDQ